MIALQLRNVDLCCVTMVIVDSVVQVCLLYLSLGVRCIGDDVGDGRGLKEDVSRERLCRKAGIRRVWCVSVENGRVYVVVFV